VAFSIHARDASGGLTEIWSRTLRPLTVQEDRGPQRFQVCAPEDVKKLILRTDAGENGSANWDWAYWAELRFSP